VRFTIERARTLVLGAGVLLLAALGAFLVIGKWKSPFNRRDLPKRLGIDIQQEANGFTHAEFHAGHATFKITASKVEQLKTGSYRLHEAKIEMYSADGKSVDRIEGNEFEYDQKAGIAKAAGPVEITLERPMEAAAALPHAAEKIASVEKSDKSPLAAVAETGQIHVKTSGLTFDEKSGIATTSRQVEFAMAQGSGSAVGATYDSQQGHLVLDHAVSIDSKRATQPVQMKAQHADFDRDSEICRLTAASAVFRGGEARADDAKVQFREDGTVDRLDVLKNVVLTTATQGRLAAPAGFLVFDNQNQPVHGHLQDGVMIDSNRGGRTVHGTSPTAELEFAARGVLHRAHLERGVHIASDEISGSGKGASQTHRAWTSPVADLEFHDTGKGQVELASIHGVGGVVVAGESQRGNGARSPSRMSADDVTGTFGPDSVLATMTGVGHASILETTAAGTKQSTTGDRLDVRFVPLSDAKVHGAERNGKTGATQIEAATVSGNVVLVQLAAAGPGAPAPAPVRATADMAVYEGQGEWLHLTGTPRVDNGELQLTADKVDVSQDSGDAFAHGNVKATWFGGVQEKGSKGIESGSGAGGQVLGGKGPAHVVASEAQLHQASGEATFRGQVRLWQEANSIAAPVIVLDRTKQTLVARAASAAEPVRVVMLNASGDARGKKAKSDTLSVIRVRGGDLNYSGATRKAVMHGGVAGTVVAETGDAITRSDEVELVLQQAGSQATQAGPTGQAVQGAQGTQVDHMTARGHVTIESQGRRGVGEQLAYSGVTGSYVLTGSPGMLPRMTDPVRGTVTGESLIFNSRNDSVNVEGGGRETTTETTVPKRP